MANIDIDTATKDELRAYVRDMARNLCEANDLDDTDLSFLETALERWDMSARFDEQELAGSLFRALTEAGIEEWAAETLADLFALDFDPDLADDQSQGRPALTRGSGHADSQTTRTRSNQTVHETSNRVRS